MTNQSELMPLHLRKLKMEEMKNVYRFIYVILFAGSSIQTAYAQVPIQLKTELDETLDSMEIVANTISLSAAIQTPDGTVWSHASGQSSFSTAVTINDSYLIGSVTKTITSACILDLAEEGLLNIDDSLHEWLPTMPFIDSNITIRQLLNHSSGLYDVLAHPNQPDSMNADFSRIWTAEELMANFMAPPNFAPGTSWSYSNTNYFLLGMIIEEVTGNPFYTELRNRFFDPLGLTSFSFPSYESNLGPVAHVWIDITGDGVLDDAHSFYMNYLSLNSTAGAAGAYYSTPTDCTKWMRAYMRGDVLSAASMLEAQTTISAPGSQGNFYGLGLMKNSIHFLGHLAYGHGGDLGYHASSWYFPAFDISITVFNNDNSKTSWNLLPVVKELLRTYIANQDAGIESLEAGAYSFGPNPFTSEINVTVQKGKADELKEVYLLNNLGQKMECRTMITNKAENSQIQLTNLESIPNGVYFVNLVDVHGATKAIKVVK